MEVKRDQRLLPITIKRAFRRRPRHHAVYGFKIARLEEVDDLARLVERQFFRFLGLELPQIRTALSAAPQALDEEERGRAADQETDELDAGQSVAHLADFSGINPS